MPAFELSNFLSRMLPEAKKTSVSYFRGLNRDWLSSIKVGGGAYLGILGIYNFINLNLHYFFATFGLISAWFT
jgi:hypothetical protein